jgi:FAD:protein FMN transferase
VSAAAVLPPLRFVERILTMGTVVSLDVRATERPAALDEAVTAVTRRLRRVDEVLSPWRPGSWISRLASDGLTLADCPVEVRDVIRLAERLDEVTAGYFSPYWRRAAHGIVAPDPTGLVKGWAAQQASDILLTHQLPNHIVNAAGDLVLSGTPAPAGPAGPTTSPAASVRGQVRSGCTWRVGIADPLHPQALAGVVALPAGPGRWAVATSGVAERGSHVVDPHTGASPTAISSATAVAPLDDCGAQAGALTDACATALVAAADQAGALLERLGTRRVHALVIHRDGRVVDPHHLLARDPSSL